MKEKNPRMAKGERNKTGDEQGNPGIRPNLKL